MLENIQIGHSLLHNRVFDCYTLIMRHRALQQKLSQSKKTFVKTRIHGSKEPQECTDPKFLLRKEEVLLSSLI